MDLTKGSIPKHIIHMSLPTMSGLLLQGLYTLVDMIWIGRISYEAVAAVTIFVSILWVFEVANEIVGMSSVALISQSFGAGDHVRVQKASEQTLTVKFLVASAAALVLCLILDPVLPIFTKDPAVIEYAKSYGYLSAAALPLFFSSFSVNTIFRCTGDAKTPMYLLAGAAVINMLLDPILMFDTIPVLGLPGFGLGVFGAALATTIAFTSAFLIGFILLLHGTKTVHISWKGLCTFDRELDKKLMVIGLPSGLEMLFRNLANSVLLKMIGVYGTAAIAIIGVGMRIYSFVFMPIIGIMLGSGTIAGQNIGAERVDRAIETAWYSSLIGGLITSIFVLLIIIFPENVLGLFLTDITDIQEGVIMLRIIAPSLIIASISQGWASVFSGSGYTIPFFISCIVAKWGIMIPYVALLIYRFHAPLQYLWYSFILSEVAEMLVLGIAFKQGKWKRKRV